MAGKDTRDLGTATSFPLEVPAASNQTFTVLYTVGDLIAAGGGLRVTFGVSASTREDCPATTDESASCGLVRVTASRPDVVIRSEVMYGLPNTGVRLVHVTATVESGELQSEDQVSVVYGAGEGGAYAQEIAQNVEVTVGVRNQPTDYYREINASPMLAVRPLAPVKLLSAVSAFDETVKISAVDRYANLADGLSTHAIFSLIDETGFETELGETEVSLGVGGMELPAMAPGYYVIRAELPELGLESLVPYASGMQKVYFGDLHFHSMFSDAYVAIDPIDLYIYAAGAMMLDFAVDTDHAECLIGNGLYTQFLHRNIPDSWAGLQLLANYVNQHGLTSLVGFELTMISTKVPRIGHMNVYYRGDSGQLYPFNYRPAGAHLIETPENLWNNLDSAQAEAITIPHHTLRSDAIGSNFLYYNSHYMRVVEIYSEHGCSESTTCPRTLYDPERDPDGLGAVQRAIGPLGYRMGFIAASDSHCGHTGGSGIPDPYFYNDNPGGLTALIADDLTRDSLWNGLYNRSVYATSGQRIYLEFSINGRNMGSEIAGTLKVGGQARAIGTGVLKQVELFKYDAKGGWRVIMSAQPDSLFWNADFEDPDFRGNSVYYVRVTQSDNEMAWSSPVWVDL